MTNIQTTTNSIYISQSAASQWEEGPGCYIRTLADIFKLLFKSLVRPHLEYASSVWCPTLNMDIASLEKVQTPYRFLTSRTIPTWNHLNTSTVNSLQRATLRTILAWSQYEVLLFACNIAYNPCNHCVQSVQSLHTMCAITAYNPCNQCVQFRCNIAYTMRTQCSTQIEKYLILEIPRWISPLKLLYWT